MLLSVLSLICVAQRLKLERTCAPEVLVDSPPIRRGSGRGSAMVWR
jgi:hypothetical protein